MNARLLIRGVLLLWVASLFWFLLLVWAAPAGAQGQTVPAGVALRASMNHDGVNTVGYRLYLDGKVLLELPVASLANNTITFNIPPVARGAHTLAASAYNADHETMSASLPFEARSPAPAPPGNLTLTVVLTVAEDGTLKLRSIDMTPTVAARER